MYYNYTTLQNVLFLIPTIQQFIHDNEVAVKKICECNHISVCVIHHSSTLCYSDDITLFQRIPRTYRVQCAAGLNADLQCLLSYGASWLLVFEPSKTHVLTVSNRRDPFSNPSIVMNGTPMIESDSLKFLGYILDSKGLWSAHIDYVVAQSRKCVGALRRICDYLSPADLCTAYKAFVHPQLEYGHLLYWGAAESPASGSKVV